MYPLSVCIPVYNRQSELTELLESISSNPEAKHIEVVIADNASSDNLSSVVDSFKHLLNINYFRNSHNLGFDANLLLALSAASGEYLWLMGSDDKISPDALSSIISATSFSKPDIIVLGRTNYSSDFLVNKGTEYFFRKQILNKHTILDTHLQRINLFKNALPLGGYFSYMSSLLISRNQFLGVLPCLYLYKKLPGYIHMEIFFLVLKSGCSLLLPVAPLVLNRTNNDTCVDPLERRFLDYNACALVSQIFTGLELNTLIKGFSSYLLPPSTALRDVARVYKYSGIDGCKKLITYRNSIFSGNVKSNFICKIYSLFPPLLIYFIWKRLKSTKMLIRHALS